MLDRPIVGEYTVNGLVVTWYTADGVSLRLIDTNSLLSETQREAAEQSLYAEVMRLRSLGSSFLLLPTSPSGTPVEVSPSSNAATGVFDRFVYDRSPSTNVDNVDLSTVRTTASRETATAFIAEYKNSRTPRTRTL